MTSRVFGVLYGIRSAMDSMTLPTDQPMVVLHHSPVGVAHMAQDSAVLLLFGHTRAGQLFSAAVTAEATSLFDMGLYPSTMQLFVSSGAGTFLQRTRIGTNDEINLIELVPEV